MLYFILVIVFFCDLRSRRQAHTNLHEYILLLYIYAVILENYTRINSMDILKSVATIGGFFPRKCYRNKRLGQVTLRWNADDNAHKDKAFNYPNDDSGH